MKVTKPLLGGELLAPRLLTNSPGRVSFKTIQRSVGQSKSPSGFDPFTQLKEIEQRLINGGPLSPEQIISCQITLNKAALNVELVSKVAEAGSTTLRKLQSNQ